MFLFRRPESDGDRRTDGPVKLFRHDAGGKRLVVLCLPPVWKTSRRRGRATAASHPCPPPRDIITTCVLYYDLAENTHNARNKNSSDSYCSGNFDGPPLPITPPPPPPPPPRGRARELIMVRFLFIKRCFSPTAAWGVGVLLNLTDKTIHQSLLTENFALYKHVSPGKQQINSLSSYTTLLPPRKLYRARLVSSRRRRAVAAAERKSRKTQLFVHRDSSPSLNVRTFRTPRREENNKSNGLLVSRVYRYEQ